MPSGTVDGRHSGSSSVPTQPEDLASVKHEGAIQQASDILYRDMQVLGVSASSSCELFTCSSMLVRLGILHADIYIGRSSDKSPCRRYICEIESAAAQSIHVGHCRHKDMAGSYIARHDEAVSHQSNLTGAARQYLYQCRCM